MAGDGAPVSSAKLVSEADPAKLLVLHILPAHDGPGLRQPQLMRGRDEGGQHPSPATFLSRLLWVCPLPQAQRVMPLQALGCCKLKMRVEPGDMQGTVFGETGGGSDTAGQMLTSTVMPVNGVVQHQDLCLASQGKLCPAAQAWAGLCCTKMLPQLYLAPAQQAASFWVQWPRFAAPQWVTLCGLTRGCCGGLFLMRQVPESKGHVGRWQTAQLPGAETRLEARPGRT